MTDAERASALADEMQSRADFAWSHGGLVPAGSMSFSDFVLLSRGARLLAEQSALSPASAGLREVVAKAIMAVGPNQTFLEMADAAISAVQRGSVIQPREPTPEMIQRLCDAVEGEMDGLLMPDDVARRVLFSVMTGEEPAP